MEEEQQQPHPDQLNYPPPPLPPGHDLTTSPIPGQQLGMLSPPPLPPHLPPDYNLINTPPIPPQQYAGVLFSHPAGQPEIHVVAPHVVPIQPPPPPQTGTRIDLIELLNIILRIVAFLLVFIAIVIVGTTKYAVHTDTNDLGDWNNDNGDSNDNGETSEGYTDYYYTPPGVYDNDDFTGDQNHTSSTFKKLSSFSPIKYFIAANSVVLIYTMATLAIHVISMIMSQQQRRGVVGGDTLRNKLVILFIVGDLAMVVLLFSAVGSAAASKDDHKHETCGGSDAHVCQKWTAGIVMSVFGAVAYLVLQLLSVFSLIVN